MTIGPDMPVDESRGEIFQCRHLLVDLLTFWFSVPHQHSFSILRPSQRRRFSRHRRLSAFSELRAVWEEDSNVHLPDVVFSYDTGRIVTLIT